MVGTLRANRRELPRLLTSHQGQECYSTTQAKNKAGDCATLLVSYVAKKNKVVNILSTLHRKTTRPKRKKLTSFCTIITPRVGLMQQTNVLAPILSNSRAGAGTWSSSATFWIYVRSTLSLFTRLLILSGMVGNCTVDVCFSWNWEMLSCSGIS